VTLARRLASWAVRALRAAFLFPRSALRATRDAGGLLRGSGAGREEGDAGPVDVLGAGAVAVGYGVVAAGGREAGGVDSTLVESESGAGAGAASGSGAGVTGHGSGPETPPD